MIPSYTVPCFTPIASRMGRGDPPQCQCISLDVDTRNRVTTHFLFLHNRNSKRQMGAQQQIIIIIMIMYHTNDIGILKIFEHFNQA